MKAFLLFMSLVLVSTGCARVRAPGLLGFVAESTVVVEAFVVSADGTAVSSAWQPLCAGVLIAPDRVLTSLDCVVPKGAGYLELGVVDAQAWATTTNYRVPARVLNADYDRRTVILSTAKPLDGVPAKPGGSPGLEGDAVIVARSPERIEKTVVMAAGARGLVGSSEVDCHELTAGAGVYDSSGRLYGIVTKGGPFASEYVAIGNGEPAPFPKAMAVRP